MAGKRLNTWASYDNTGRKYEENIEPSLTIPDQTLTVKQIIARYVRKQPVVRIEGTFDEGAPASVARLSKLDKMEKMELLQENKEKIADLKAKTTRKTPKKKVNPSPTPPETSKEEG